MLGPKLRRMSNSGRPLEFGSITLGAKFSRFSKVRCSKAQLCPLLFLDISFHTCLAVFRWYIVDYHL